MKYYDGSDVKIGDYVDLGQGDMATLICLIEEGAYLEGIKREDWAYLKVGVVFKSENFGPIYFRYPDEDTVLVSRINS